MKTVMTILMVALLVGPATAQIDPDPDGMSVYFDTEGYDFCYETSGGYEEVTAYLLLTNPSAEFLYAWEAHVESDVDAWYSIHWEPVCTSYGWDMDPDFVVGCSPPVPLDGSTVILMTGLITFQGAPSEYAIFTVRGIPGSISFDPDHPGYAAGPGILVPCNLIHDAPGDPVAWINRPDDCLDFVANEASTWGTVKRLY